MERRDHGSGALHSALVQSKYDVHAIGSDATTCMHLARGDIVVSATASSGLLACLHAGTEPRAVAASTRFI